MENENVIRTDSNAYNAGTKQKQLIHEEISTVQNYEIIMKAMKEGRAYDIADEPKKNGDPCFIIGSSQSLDDALPLMNKWKGGIICSSSHALAFIKYGAEPDYIMVLDPFCFWNEIKGIDWSKTKTKIITHPGAWPDLLKNWPNEILLYLQNSGRQDSFYATTQKHMYANRKEARDTNFDLNIRTEITIFACSPPAQLFAAGVIGYGRMFLAGCGFGFANGKRRFTEWSINETDEWVSHPHPFNKETQEDGFKKEDLIMGNNGYPLTQIMVYYKKNLISAWRLSLMDTISTDIGNMSEFPYATPEKVIHHQGGSKIKSISKEEIIKRSEKYLAKVGAFVVCADTGLSFVECKYPLIDLPMHMLNMAKDWRCEGCKLTIPAQGLEEITEPCPQCKGKFKRINEVNIEENMKRIYKLLYF